MATKTETAPGAGGPGRGGRMSRRRQRDAVLRLLRGEDLETVSRSLGVTAAALSGWRDVFLAAGEAGLATRPTDGEAADNPLARLHIGEATDGHAPLLDAHGPAQRGRAA